MKNICIICSEFNKEIVDSLLKNSETEIQKSKEEINYNVVWVTGAGEIPLTAKWAAEKNKYDGILALGAVIRGETTHYDTLSRVLETALWDLQKQYSLPIIFSVLMLESREQVKNRVGRRVKEAVQALICMMKTKEQME